ncbi:MAG: shikimate kinase, partial [Oscillospiraceae bacterium]
MAKNIVLIGLPGCGKTTFGRQIAKKMNMAFIDLDDMIKTMAGKSIPQIFAESGEDNFRKITKDHSVVEELISANLITEEEARSHPRRNQITRA